MPVRRIILVIASLAPAFSPVAADAAPRPKARQQPAGCSIVLPAEAAAGATLPVVKQGVLKNGKCVAAGSQFAPLVAPGLLVATGAGTAAAVSGGNASP